LVPDVARREAFLATQCPSDCPYAHPTGISSTVTGVATSWSFLGNVILFGWANRLFGDGWHYTATAQFTWRATANCRERRPELALRDIEEVTDGPRPA